VANLPTPFDAGPLTPELQVAVAAAQAAGHLAQGLQSGVSHSCKSDGSPVTAGDLAANDLILGHLAAAFPTDGILSEETGESPDRRGRSRLWIIDPIDGTTDYVAGSPEWAVQLALAIDGVLALGVLALPGHGLTLVGLPGRGAWQIGADGIAPLRIVHAAVDTLISSHSTRNRRVVAQLQRSLPEFALVQATSVGIKTWKLIHGLADLYVHPRRIAEWDVAAPAAVLQAVGGTASDLAGRDLRFNSASGRCPGLIFSVRPDHAAIVARLRDLPLDGMQPAPADRQAEGQAAPGS
jgi:3'(2'), 5'-bisphosphate nucleotidase